MPDKALASLYVPQVSKGNVNATRDILVTKNWDALRIQSQAEAKLSFWRLPTAASFRQWVDLCKRMALLGGDIANVQGLALLVLTP